MKIVFANVQCAIGATGGYFQWILKFYKYIFPHNSKPLGVLAEDFKKLDADVLLLVEVDGGSFRSPVNHVDYLNNLIQYDFTRFIHTTHLQGYANQGYGIISRYPIVAENSYKLTSYYDQRILQYFRLETEEGNLSLFIAHLGISRSERNKQVEEIISVLKNYDTPYIMTGDFNFTHAEATGFNGTGLIDLFPGENTLPTWNPKQETDKFFVTPGIIVKSRKVMRETVFSDHLPICIDIHLK